MNTITKTILAAVGAVLFTSAPALASAERVYFLVGTRHVYRIGNYQYDHLPERQKIEQDYADGIAADKDTYDKAIAGGADPAVEGPPFNKALEDRAVERDQRLGAIFENADYERDRHPQLRLEGDGPYQVIGINFHVHANVEVFDDFVVYAPWPGYVVVDRPYGWSYGVVYTPGVFFNLYIGWHAGFIAAGSPFFFGFVGRSGPIGVLGISRGAHGGFESHGGFGHVIGRSGSFGHGGYSAGRAIGSSRYSAGRSGYSHGSFGTRTSTSARYGSSSHTSSSSKYSAGHSTGSFGHGQTGLAAHSGSGSSHGTSGYGHASTGRSTSSSTHSSNASGSFSHSSSHSHSSFGSSHSSGTSSHSSGGASHSSGGGSHKKG